MKKLIPLFLILICTTAHAETVRVYKDYNPVRILYLLPGSDADVEASKSGLAGSFKEMDSSDLPQNRDDRDFWTFEKGAIKIDTEKKNIRADKKTKKSTDRASAIGKLKATGLTDDELAALKIGE